MKGKCNCGKKAVSEFLIRNKKAAWTMKFCSDCKPKHEYQNIIKIN
jgi:hypothetical protein